MVSENAKDNQPTLGHLPDTCLSPKHVTVTVGGCHTVKMCQVWCTRNFRTSSSAVAISSHSHDYSDHPPAITDNYLGRLVLGLGWGICLLAPPVNRSLTWRVLQGNT